MSQSAVTKLQKMPECFTDKVFMRLSGLSAPSAKVALSRMRAANLVQSAGNRSGIYYNLLKNSKAADECAVDALLTTYPSAILHGESVLHNAGWITQIPPAITVAVIARRSYQQIDGFDIKGKPLDWFKQVNGQLVLPKDADFATYGLKALRPENALLELFKSGNPIDIDDLTIPDESIEAVAQLLDGLDAGLVVENKNHLSYQLR